jgi:hypothetical protein
MRSARLGIGVDIALLGRRNGQDNGDDSLRNAARRSWYRCIGHHTSASHSDIGSFPCRRSVQLGSDGCNRRNATYWSADRCKPDNRSLAFRLGTTQYTHPQRKPPHPYSLFRMLRNVAHGSWCPRIVRCNRSALLGKGIAPPCRQSRSHKHLRTFHSGQDPSVYPHSHPSRSSPSQRYTQVDIDPCYKKPRCCRRSHKFRNAMDRSSDQRNARRKGWFRSDKHNGHPYTAVVQDSADRIVRNVGRRSWYRYIPPNTTSAYFQGSSQGIVHSRSAVHSDKLAHKPHNAQDCFVDQHTDRHKKPVLASKRIGLLGTTPLPYTQGCIGRNAADRSVDQHSFRRKIGGFGSDKTPRNARWCKTHRSHKPAHNHRNSPRHCGYPHKPLHSRLALYRTRSFLAGIACHLCRLVHKLRNAPLHRADPHTPNHTHSNHSGKSSALQDTASRSGSLRLFGTWWFARYKKTKKPNRPSRSQSNVST